MRRLYLLLAVCLFMACTRSEAEAPAARAPEPALPASVLETADVHDFAKIVDERLRLRPDRRFLLAVGDVYELANGKRLEPEVAFDGKVWRVTAAGRELGTLPEIPTFEDGVELVRGVAHTVNVKGVTAADAEKVTTLNLQLQDKLGLADPIRARALALVAIAGVKDTASLKRAFGYAGEQVAIEGGLKPRPALSPALATLYDEVQQADEWYERYDYVVDHLGSRNAGNEFVSGIEAKSPVQQQVRDWFAFAVAAKYEGGGDVKPRAALVRTNLIGGDHRAWLLNRYGDAIGLSDADLHRAVFDLFPQLDTRPAHMYEAGLIAHRILDDPVRRARYLAGSTEDGIRAWTYSLAGDNARLREIAESRDATAADRATALSALGELPDADHAYVTRKFVELLRETYDVYPTFANYVNERGDWKEKEAAARRWLAKHPEDASPIEVAYYASSLADALEQLGRYDEAWAVVEPHVGVWSANIISGAMSILDHRGKTEEAIELGKQYIERYHGAEERADLARIYWRRGRFAEAANLFRPDQRLNASEVRWELPKAFIESLRGEMSARVAQAFDAVVDAGVDTWVITDLVGQMVEAKQPEHVLAMIDVLTKRGWHANTPQGSDVFISGWRALREAKGIEAANQWLAPRVPDSAAMQFVSISYQNAQHELVLAYATPRLDRLKSIEMLTFIASSLTFARVPANDPRRTALIEAVRKEGDQPKTLLPVAQYLLDMMDEEAFMRWPYEPPARTTVAYFIGLKAASRGDYDKALPWLIAAADGDPMNPPRAWAMETLARWSRARMTWKEIAAAGLL